MGESWARQPLMFVVELGVFAKKQIPKRTQFGPFVAPMVSEPLKAGVGKLEFMVR